MMREMAEGKAMDNLTKRYVVHETGQIHTVQNFDIRQAAPEGVWPMELIWRDDQEHKR